MTYSLTWLPDVLKAVGLKVIEEHGWQTRGHGNVGTIRGVLCHHTAGAKSGNMPSLTTVIQGRPNLSGPLCNLALGRDGTWFIVAAGRAYHAGPGLWQGIKNGNSQMIGIEAENTGFIKGPTAEQPWSKPEYDSYVKGVAALLKHIGAQAIMAAGHKEYALPKGRKTDPTFDMVKFRQDVTAAMAK